MTNVMSSKTRGVPLSRIMREVKENEAFADTAFEKFKTEDGLKAVLDELIAEGFVSTAKDPRLGLLYKQSRPYNAGEQDALAEEARVMEEEFVPAAPRTTVGSIPQISPEMRNQLGMLYFFCNAWISSYINRFKGHKKSPDADAENWWKYVLNGIRNLSAQKDREGEGLLAGWKEIGIDFTADEGIVALRKELEGIEKDYEKAKDGAARDVLSIQANRLVAELANKSIGAELGEILPAAKMYDPVPENTGDKKLDKDKRHISRVLVRVDAKKSEDRKIADLGRNLVSHIRDTSLPSRFMGDQNLGDAPDGDMDSLVSNELYKTFKPKGGLMNMSEFLTILLSMVNEATPTIKLAQKDDVKIFVGIPKEQSNMIGRAEKGGQLPVGSAPNAPRQRDNLMAVMGRKIPNRIISIIQTGFPVWFNHALNAPLTPPGKIVPPSESAIAEVASDYGEPSEDAKLGVQFMDPSIPGFFDKAPNDQMDKAMMGIATALAYAHGDGKHKDDPAIIALMIAGTNRANAVGGKVKFVLDEELLKRAQKAIPQYLIYKGDSEGQETLRGRHDKDGKIIWHNAKDENVSSPDSYEVSLDINNYDLFGNLRRLDKQIDADYAYAHLHFVQWPIEMMMAEREAIVDQTLGEKGMNVREHIMKKHGDLKSGKDRLLGRDSYALRPVATATGLKLLNNFITAIRASHGKTGGLVAEARERGMKDDDIKDALPRGVALDGPTFNADVDKVLIEKQGAVGEANRSEVFLPFFKTGERRFDNAINHMLLNLAAIDKRLYDYSAFDEAMQAQVELKPKQYKYTMSALDDRHQSAHAMSSSWPGVKDAMVTAMTKKYGLEAVYSYVERQGGSDEHSRSKPYPIIEQIGSYDMLRSIAIDMISKEPALASLSNSIFGSALRKVFVNTKLGATAYYQPSGSTIGTGAKFAGHLAHEFGHAIDFFFGGYIQSEDKEGTSGYSAGEDDGGASLSRMDDFIKEIQSGKVLTKDRDLTRIIRAFYRIPYFSQFTARSPDEVFDLMDKDRPRAETMDILAKAAEKARKAGKDPHAAARETLNQMVGEAISLHMPSPIFAKSALSGQIFGGDPMVDENLTKWHETKESQYREGALKFINALMLGKASAFVSYEGKFYYWSSAEEFFARSFDTAFLQKMKDDNLITGGEEIQTTLTLLHDSLQESDPAQSRRLMKAVGQMFEGAKVSTQAEGITKFYTGDLSALLSNASPEEVMDAAVDVALPQKERKNPDVPTALKSHIPAYQRRLQAAAYGEEAVLFVAGDKFGEFNTIGRIPTDIAEKVLQALSFIPDGVKTPLHAYHVLEEKVLPMKDIHAERQMLGILGDWLRANMEGENLKQKSADMPLPDMETYKQQNHKVLDNLFVNKEVPYVAKDPSRDYVPVSNGLAFGKPLTLVKEGMQEQNAPKTPLWSDGELAEKLGMTEAELEEAMFPNGVGGRSSLDQIQYEAVKRILQWNLSAPKYKVKNNKHQAQIFHFTKKMEDPLYKPGFIEALGTGVGKTFIHVTIARIKGIAARKKADDYLKNNNPKGMSHEKLWEEDSEYRKIVSEGVAVLVTGGAEKGGLNRGTRKALVELKMIPKKVGEIDVLSKEFNEIPMVEGIDGKWRYINAPYFTKKLKAKNKREFVPRVGDFILYDTYQSLMNDNYSELQREDMPGAANSKYQGDKNEPKFDTSFVTKSDLKTFIDQFKKKIGLRLSKVLEPPQNFRRLLHMLGIEGALEEIPYDKKTGKFTAPSNWKRADGFYDFNRYNEFGGTMIFDEADNMSGIKEQNYGETRRLQARIKKEYLPAYGEEISDISSESGVQDPSNMGILGRELTRLFPNANVVFGTATPFKSLSSFASMERAILTFSSETQEDSIFDMVTKIQMGGNQGIVDFLSDLSERGAGIRGNLSPPPSSVVNIPVTEDEEALYQKMHTPIRTLLSLPAEKFAQLMGVPTKEAGTGQIRKNLAAALSILSPMIGEALLMQGAWGEQIEKARAQGKSVIIPSESIGSSHDNEIIKADILRKSIFGFGEIEWQDKEKTLGIAPIEFFTLRGRIRRSLTNALPVFSVYKAGEVAAEKDPVARVLYPKQEKTLNVYELFFRNNFEDISQAAAEHASKVNSEFAKRRADVEDKVFYDTLLSVPSIKINEEENTVEFSLSKRQVEGVRKILDKMRLPGLAARWMEMSHTRTMKPEEVRDYMTGRWGITDFGEFNDPKSGGAHIQRKGGKITIGVKSRGMTELVTYAMGEIPHENKMQTVMTQLQNKFGDDFIEVSGRNWIQKDNPNDEGKSKERPMGGLPYDLHMEYDPSKTVILTRRNPGDNNSNQIVFQEKKNGAVLFGNPDSMGRGLDFDWQHPFEEDGKKFNQNQTPRLMMIANPPKETNLLMQVFGRIKRRSTVDTEGAAEVSMVSSNLTGMRVRVLRSMNMLMRLNELSTGDEKQALRGAGIKWSVDPEIFFTRDETTEAVRDIGLDVAFGKEGKQMDLDTIFSYLGIRMKSSKSSAESKAAKKQAKSDTGRAKSTEVSQLFKRMGMLPQHVAQDLLNTIERNFRDIWNKNPDKGKSAVLDGNISPFSSYEGVEGVSPGGKLDIFNYQHAPANQSFEHVFGLPPAMRDMDPAEAKQMLDKNHLFYRIPSPNGNPKQDKIIGVDFLREREDINVHIEDDRQYRVYEFGETGRVPVQIWKKASEVLPKSMNPEKAEISREEAKKIWEVGVENMDANLSQQLIYAVRGNPAAFTLPGDVSFRPVLMPDPAGGGEFISGYVLDDNYETIIRQRHTETQWMESNFSQTLGRLDGKYGERFREAIAYVRRMIEKEGGEATIRFPKGGISLVLREQPDPKYPKIKTVTVVEAGARMESDTPGSDLWRKRTGGVLEEIITKKKQTTVRDRSYEELARAATYETAWKGKSLEQFMREVVFYLGFPIVDEEAEGDTILKKDDSIKPISIDVSKHTDKLIAIRRGIGISDEEAKKAGEKFAAELKAKKKGDTVLKKEEINEEGGNISVLTVKAPPVRVIDKIKHEIKQEKQNWTERDAKQMGIALQHIVNNVIWVNLDDISRFFFPNSTYKLALWEMAKNSSKRGENANYVEVVKDIFFNLTNKNIFPNDEDVLAWIEKNMPKEKKAHADGFYDLVFFARHYQRISDTFFPQDVNDDIVRISKSYDVPISPSKNLPKKLALATTIRSDNGKTTAILIDSKLRDKELWSAIVHELWHAIVDIPAEKWGMANVKNVKRFQWIAEQVFEKHPNNSILNTRERAAHLASYLAADKGGKLRIEIIRAAGRDKSFVMFLQKIIEFFRAVLRRIGLSLYPYYVYEADKIAASIFRARRMGKKGEPIDMSVKSDPEEGYDPS